MGRYLLAVLEATVCGRSVLLVVILLLAAIVALGSTTLLLGRVARLLIATLFVTLLWRILTLALALGRVLLVALVVLIVGARHYEYVEFVRLRSVDEIVS